MSATATAKGEEDFSCGGLIPGDTMQALALAPDVAKTVTVAFNPLETWAGFKASYTARDARQGKRGITQGVVNFCSPELTARDLVDQKDGLATPTYNLYQSCLGFGKPSVLSGGIYDGIRLELDAVDGFPSLQFHSLDSAGNTTGQAGTISNGMWLAAAYRFSQETDGATAFSGTSAGIYVEDGTNFTSGTLAYRDKAGSLFDLTGGGGAEPFLADDTVDHFEATLATAGNDKVRLDGLGGNFPLVFGAGFPVTHHLAATSLINTAPTTQLQNQRVLTVREGGIGTSAAPDGEVQMRSMYGNSGISTLTRGGVGIYSESNLHQGFMPSLVIGADSSSAASQPNGFGATVQFARKSTSAGSAAGAFQELRNSLRVGRRTSGTTDTGTAADFIMQGSTSGTVQRWLLDAELLQYDFSSTQKWRLRDNGSGDAVAPFGTEKPTTGAAVPVGSLTMTVNNSRLTAVDTVGTQFVLGGAGTIQAALEDGDDINVTPSTNIALAYNSTTGSWEGQPKSIFSDIDLGTPVPTISGFNGMITTAAVPSTPASGEGTYGSLVATETHATFMSDAGINYVMTGIGAFNQADDATQGTVLDLYDFLRTTSNVAGGTNGIGSRITFSFENDNNVDTLAVALEGVADDVTDTAEDARLDIYCQLAGSKALAKTIRPQAEDWPGLFGDNVRLEYFEAEQTGATGTTVTFTNLLPASSTVMVLGSRVTTAFGVTNGLTSIDIGDTGASDVDAYGATLAITGGSTSGPADWTVAGASTGLNGRDVVVTANGGTGFDGTGDIRISGWAMVYTAPTS
jgi:hypothetical protein